MIDFKKIKSFTQAVKEILGYNYLNVASKQKLIKVCFEKYGVDIIAIVEKNKKKYCLNCGREIKGDRKFCNSSCAATYNNKKRKPKTYEEKKKISDSLKNFFLEKAKKENKNYTPKEYKPKPKGNDYCVNCGKKLNKRQQNRFCSIKCYFDYKYKEDVKRWKNGEDSGFWEGCAIVNVKNFVRKYLLEKNNYACELCGWHEINPVTGVSPLHIHHIDGDCTNNKEENLQLLCPNCHSLTETFGSLNKNSKRKRKKK